MNECPEQDNHMDCKPEKENLLLAYRDKFISIKQTYPEWSDTDVRLQTAADLRPQFRLNRDAGYRENLGLSEYEVPEAVFTLTEGGSVWYTKYGQGLLEFHERQLRLTPETYSPEEHAISLLIEEYFKRGATSVVTSYGDRDLVVMHFDPITMLGTTKIIDATKQQSTVWEIAKKRYAHFESLHLTDKIFLFTDKKLSIQHATEVIKPIMKQRMKTKLGFDGVQQFVSIHQKQEDKHIQPPFYKRLFAYAEDSFRQEGQIRPETHASVAPKKLEPERGIAPVHYDDKQLYDWVQQKKVWDTSVQTRVMNNASKQRDDTILPPDQPPLVQRIKQKEIIQEQKQIALATSKVLFQSNISQPVREQRIIHSIEQTKAQNELEFPFVLPLTTFITMTVVQTVFKYEEKAIAVSIVANHRKHKERTMQQYIPATDQVPAMVYQQKEEEQDMVTQQRIQERIKEEAVYKVDQLSIQGVNELTEKLGKQIVHGESPFCTVKKLLWMIPHDHSEKLVPVEEVEIAQDSTRTLQNLLHFLRKVVRKYIGEDSIRPRVVQRIASDKWDNEIEEIAEYLTILKTQWMYRHLFAVVN